MLRLATHFYGVASTLVEVYNWSVLITLSANYANARQVSNEAGLRSKVLNSNSYKFQYILQ